MRYIKFFSEISAKDTPLVGGKNANLGEMYNKLADTGVPVPNGFAVTAEGYDYFIKFNNLEEKIHNVLKGLDTHNIEDLHKRGEEIRNLIKSGEFPEDLKNEILSAFQKLKEEYGEDLTVAVRSSATAEDLPSIAEEEPCFCKINGKIRYLKIKDVYDLYEKGIKDIKVLCLTENLKIKWMEISGMYKHPVNNRKLIKIVTRSGREITVTPDHSVLVLDNDNFNFYPQRAENIKVGDFVPSVKNIPLILDREKIIEVEKYIDSNKEIIKENDRIKIKSKKHKIKNDFPAKIIIDDDFAYFIGLYLAEGSIYLDKKGRYTIDISCESEVLANKAAQFLRKYKIKYRIDKNIRINNEILGIFLKNICGAPDFSKKGKGKSAKIKKVPDFIFNQDKKIIASLLRGYFDGDGYVGKRDIKAVSVSKDLINTLSFCLQLLQIKTYLKSYTKNGNKVYSLIIPYDQIRIFNRLIGFTEKKQKVKIFDLIKDYENKNKHQDFIDIIPKSSFIEKKIERENLIKINKFKEVERYRCDRCLNPLINHGTYNLVNGEKIKRYFCKNCNYWPSEKNVIKERIKVQILDRDGLGRFYVGFTPWNKGLRNKTSNYGRKEFIKNLKKNNVVSEKLWDIAYSDIIFDKIVKIEEVHYNGYVYDFIVPPYENFSAGFGGLITHNTASFAGQQETYLNVSEKDLLEKIKFCFASLFTDRAISYREDKGFDHFKVKLSVAVQKMVRSDVGSSGVMFTIDPDNGCPNVIVINSVFGLGELIVQGKVVPDEFMVFKPRMEADTTSINADNNLPGYQPDKIPGLKTDVSEIHPGNSSSKDPGKSSGNNPGNNFTFPIISKKLGEKNRKIVYAEEGGVKEVETTEEERRMFSLTDEEVRLLAKYGYLIEKHYGKPMDIEWAKDGIENKLYIVQARPETVHSTKQNVWHEYRLKTNDTKQHETETKPREILKGIAIGSQITAGRVRVIRDVEKINEFQAGEILVTEMTDPDWEPIMKIAKGIIAEKGGRTSHCAIVARELGIPAIVGVSGALEKLKTGDEITIDNSQGLEGRIYQGILEYEVIEHKLEEIPQTKTKVYVNIGEPDEALEKWYLPVKGVGLAREEFIIASEIKIHPNALIDYPNLPQEVKEKIDELTKEYEDKKQFYIDKLAEGIAKIGASFYPNEVIVRFSDFKTNEYRNLIGGEIYEPKEENPMIGWRGASRYYHPNFRKAFELEVLAIKKVREEMKLKNVVVMVPFCRTPEEGKQVVQIIRSIIQDPELKIYVMCEIPSNVLLADEFLEIFDGMSIGSNDLTQLVLGIDRDNEMLTQIADERNPAVLKMLEEVIRKCKEKGKYIGICGQAPSDFPEIVEFLVKNKIDSISVNPDAVIKTINLVKEVETNKNDV